MPPHTLVPAGTSEIVDNYSPLTLQIILLPKSYTANPLFFEEPESRLYRFVALGSVVIPAITIIEVEDALPTLHYALA